MPAHKATKFKVCGKCKRRRPRGEFYRSKQSQDGLQYSCKECMKRYNKSRRKKRKFLDSQGTDPIARARFIHFLHCKRAHQEVWESDLSAEDLLTMWQQAVRCPDCGKKFTKRARPKNLDHIYPLARGGKHMKDNVRIVCGPCNQAKGAQLPSSTQLPSDGASA